MCYTKKLNTLYSDMYKDGLGFIERPLRLSKGNKKIANYVGIFNLPAGKSCLNCSECYDTCYARGRELQFANVRNFRQLNFDLAKNDIKTLKYLLLKQIFEERLQVIRIHESGDFISSEYVQMWKEIAEEADKTNFYCYTKVLGLFKHDLESMPENVNVINSFVPFITDYPKGATFYYTNYGTEEEINWLKNSIEEYAAYNENREYFICPEEGCMITCNYCLKGKYPLFKIHGMFKNKGKK